MATPIQPKVKGRKRIQRKRPPKPKSPPGAAPLAETVHLIGTGAGRKLVCFTFSQDIVERLMDLHDARYEPLIYAPRAQRLRRARLQVVRLMDIGIPSVMVMIEPQITWDPRGRLLRRVARRYTCTVSAHRIGLRAGIPRRDPDWFWAENMQGLIINLPDEDISPDPPPPRKPGDPIDLVAR